MMEISKRLIEAIRSKQAVVVVGTGSSVAASGAPTASWLGLIEDGVKVLERDGYVDKAWSSAVRAMLSVGTSTDNASFLIQAASQVGEAFRKAGLPGYTRWLEGTIGDLRITSPEVLRAITQLPLPLLTTNYDTLIEQVADRQSVTWMDPPAMQQVLAIQTPNVGHLHGVWNQPDSVILTTADYSRITADAAAQAVQRALATLKHVIYIGVGSGLQDPNFSKLLEWQRETFPTSAMRHFRLCLEEEVAQLNRLHAPDNIEPVVYGTNHGDLSAFLIGLHEAIADIPVTSSGLIEDKYQEVRRTFEEELRDELIADGELREDRPLDELALPPVILPVPHAEYVSAKRESESGKRINRLNPDQEATRGGIVILAGEENSGVSFAAKWLALTCSKLKAETAPALVSFTADRPGGKRLPYRVRQSLRAAGMTLSNKEPLPRLTIVLDDYSPSVGDWSTKALTDLLTLPRELTIITCRQGTEEDVQRQLTDRGIEARVRYVGRLERPDITKLVERSSNINVMSVVSAIERILISERLPRTPFTVAQLLFILQRNGQIATDASQTSVLEEFVEMLLGRGEPAASAAFATDYEQRMAILEYLAEHLVENDVQGLTEGEVVAEISRILAALGWPESPVDLLQDFRERGLLVRRSAFIQFTRASYLHLFIARRAGKSTEFRDKLLSRPDYYFVAIAHYAALTRHDPVLFERLEEWLDETVFLAENGAAYELVTPVAADLGRIPIGEADEDSSEGADADESADRETLETPDPLATLGDDDPPAFPVAVETDVPRIRRLMQTLDLSSRVLRDADQAGMLQTKTALLSTVLDGWGRLVSEVIEDPDFQSFFSALLAGVLDTEAEDEDESPSPEARRGLLEKLEKMIPAAFVYGGITVSLASRKLSIALDQVAATSGDESPEVTTAAAFLTLAIEDPGWPSKLAVVLDGQEKRWVVQEFLRWLVVAKYLEDEHEARDESALLDLCVQLMAGGHSFSNEKQRKEWTGKVRANLSRQKAAASRRRRQHGSIPLKSSASDS